MIRQECYRPWFLVTGVLLIALAINVAWTANTEPRIHDALREQGIATSMAEIKAGYPEPPEEENAATLYMKAIGILKMLEAKDESESVRHWLPSYGAEVWLFSPEAPDYSQYVENMRVFLKERQEVLSLLHQAATREQCRWPDAVFELYAGYDTLEIYAHMREFSRILLVDSYLAALDGDVDRVVTNFETNGALGRAMRSYPTYQAILIRNTTHNLHLEALEKLFALPEMDMTTGHLQRIMTMVRQWGSVYPKVHRQAILSEFVLFYVHRYQRGLHSTQVPLYMEGHERIRTRAYQHSLRYGEMMQIMSGFFESGRIHVADLMRQVKELPENVPQNTSFDDMIDHFPTNQVRYMELNIGLRPLLYGQHHMVSQYAVTKAGIAVQQYYQDHGVYPESLAALTPQYLDAVPDNPWLEDRPFAYYRSDTGARVYALRDVRRQVEIDRIRQSGDREALETYLKESISATKFRFGAFVKAYYQDETAENHFEASPESESGLSLP